MVKKKKREKKLAKKLLHKYRLVVLNEDTFEEKFAFKLTRLNVFVSVGISVLVLIIFTTLLIAFTPLREYIPGYSSTKLKTQATQLLLKTDSLQRVLHQKNEYFNSIRKVLNGDVTVEEIQGDSLKPNLQPVAEVILSPSKEDSLLRQEVEQEDKYNVIDAAVDKTDFKLFPPVKGQITESYNPEENHFAVDIVTPKNTPVKAAAEGTVIFAEWTAETGYVLIIEHRYGLISVYKHNSSLAKSQGELVRKGEVVAMVGSTGELTTGPHLHFELWSNGRPVNPTDFLEFE
ncbi:M23 family metallopeptidase [Mesonia aestuariivivens]|uniref:M23 family metallopeptidase n=1 Tax=Mesonia aestuariivivens TaxID=2796128 RepID=A0ABS6W106_9FLAO|nr:M23 family metallopeptidase [Mesonia aestuariivivens]MBW2961540.1 M23 family metallopeptidase [Mesonia aestuariivivens]